MKVCNTKCTSRHKYSKHFNSQSFVILVSCWLEPYESCTCIFLETVFNYVIFSRIAIEYLKYELTLNTDVTAENGCLTLTYQLNETTNQWEINIFCASAVWGSTLTNHICVQNNWLPTCMPSKITNVCKHYRYTVTSFQLGGTVKNPAN